MDKYSHHHFNMSFQIIRTVLVIISLSLTNGLKPGRIMNYDRSKKICKELGKEPFFDIEMVIGKPWRIYYTWNVDMANKCLDMTAKNATRFTSNRFYTDMNEYLETQPAWDAATLHITMGTARHEILLFADQGSEGTFLAVPNVMRDGNITPRRKAVPMLTFFLKLFRDGKFLLMMDCHIGVASLMSREHPPYRSEVMSVAHSINIGDGMHACVAETRKDEKIPELESDTY